MMSDDAGQLETIAPDDVWTSSALYRVRHLADTSVLDQS